MNEKERIIKLLEEGKITAEEATKLLNAIKEPYPTVGKEAIDTIFTLLKKATLSAMEELQKEEKEKK